MKPRIRHIGPNGAYDMWHMLVDPENPLSKYQIAVPLKSENYSAELEEALRSWMWAYENSSDE